MNGGRHILVEHLHRLMKAKGWVQPNGEWNIAALHEKVKGSGKGSRRWLYRLLRGETDFTIGTYERILQMGFGQSVESVLTGQRASTAPRDRDVEDLQEELRVAIDNARQTNTLEGLRHGLRALFEKAASDRALQDKTREVKERARSPRKKNRAV